MLTLRQDLAYALRQMRLSPVFTLTAMLTLALGIGATTAIFSLIHTVMLKSLPVVDPASLYRIGEGDDCCIEGSTQDTWGFYSWDFYGRCRPTRRSSLARRLPGRGVDPGRAPRRIRSRRQNRSARKWSAAITFPPSDSALLPAAPSAQRRPAQLAARRHAQLSHVAAAVRLRPFHRRLYPHRQRPSRHHHRNHPAGYFGETLRANPPDLWLPINQEAHLRRLRFSPASLPGLLRVIGRLRPGASVNTTGPRMTASFASGS